MSVVTVLISLRVFSLKRLTITVVPKSYRSEGQAFAVSQLLLYDRIMVPLRGEKHFKPRPQNRILSLRDSFQNFLQAQSLVLFIMDFLPRFRQEKNGEKKTENQERMFCCIGAVKCFKSNMIKSGEYLHYKLIAILRRQYHIILTASWEKIYSVLGGVAKRRSPIRNIFSPNAVNIMWYCRLKIAISFVSRSIIYKDK